MSGPALRPRELQAEILRQTVAEASGKRQSFFDWAMRVPEPKTGILNFARFPYQRELYDQHSAEDVEAVVKKATQVGVSTYLLRWIMYLVDVRGLTGLYLFPKRTQMYDFADARIKAAILASDYLRRRIAPGDVQNKGLKQIGTGYLYCRGSESKDDLQSIDADGLAMDEYDDIRPENIPDAERRLSGSEYKLLRRVGVPDLPGRGLDLLYEQSDKRRWMVKCERCGHHQAIAYDANMDEDAEVLICAECRKGPLDVAQGEWVPEHPDRDVRGYHISRLIVPHQDLHSIIESHAKTNPTEVKTHFNKDLGEAYAPEEGRLSLDRIKAAQRDDIALDSGGARLGRLRTMGVDVASTRALNVRISAYDEDGRKRSLYLGLAKDFAEVGRLFRAYDVHMACVDHLPEGRLARAFAEKFPGRVYLVNYAGGNQGEILKLNPELRHASVRRLEAIDATLDSIRQQMNLLPGELPKNYVRDLQNFVRVVEYDEYGKPKVTYRELGPTDWAQAEIYDVVAHDVWWALRSIEEGTEGTIQTLDELYDFERSQLDIGGSGGGDYDPGFTDD